MISAFAEDIRSGVSMRWAFEYPYGGQFLLFVFISYVLFNGQHQAVSSAAPLHIITRHSTECHMGPLQSSTSVHKIQDEHHYHFWYDCWIMSFHCLGQNAKYYETFLCIILRTIFKSSIFIVTPPMQSCSHTEIRQFAQ
jgi:hypothetical protein